MNKMLFSTILILILIALPYDVFAVTENFKITASDAIVEDEFGNSVAISGNKAIVGKLRDGDNGFVSGAAYIFDFDGTNWIETAKITASDGVTLDTFGNSVAIDGTRVIVSSQGDDNNGGTNSGAAYIFDFDGTNWIETAKITASDAAGSARFGSSVSISGNQVIVGSSLDDACPSVFSCNSGSAYIFDFDGTNWIETAKITASDADTADNFGISVSISGNKVIVGALDDDDAGLSSGSAYIFDFDGTAWNETKITASDAAAGDHFGFSVSISGDKIIVGAFDDDDAGIRSGSAYVFDFDGTAWNETKITASDAAASSGFGNSVSINGNKAIVGAPLDTDAGIRSGSAYVFDFDGTTWSETVKLTPSDGAAFDAFGRFVSINGNKAIVGSNFDDDAGLSSGSAYIFEFNKSPEITAFLIPINIDDDEGLFQIQFDVTDDNDIPLPTGIADINGISVINGQTVKLEIEEFMGNNVEYDDGILNIEAPIFVLSVNATDSDGESTTVTAIPSFDPPTTINIIGDITGDQNIGLGQTLTINGVTVVGDIKVDGGTLIINAGSTITGDIKTKNCSEINVQSSTINGKIKSKNCSIVVIADNVISDKVDVKGNTNVTINGNIISGLLKIKENTTCVAGNNLATSYVMEGCLTS